MASLRRVALTLTCMRRARPSERINMKILYIALSCGPNLGSEDAVGWNIPLEVVRLGHDVTVATRSDKRLEIEEYISNHIDQSYPHFIYFDLPRIATYCKGPLYSVRAKLWCNAVSSDIQRLCDSECFDVIHQITPVEFRSLVDMTGIQGVKVVGPMGGGGKINKEFNQYLDPFSRIIERLRECANFFTVHGRKARNALLSHDIVMAANCETAIVLRQMGWQAELPIQSEVAVSEVCTGKTRNGRRNKSFTVGFAGRFHYRKGLLFLLDAIALLKPLNVKLFVAGDGQQRSIVEKRVSQLGLEENVVLLGAIAHNEMQRYYSSLDVFAFPSFQEATGTVLVEALAAGVPVVAFNQFGAREVLSDSQEALVSVADNIEQTRRLFANKLIEAVRREGKACKPETWSQHTTELIKLYKSKMQENT